MTERYAYTYDAWGRPMTVTHKLDNASQWTQLHSYAYDGAGRLVMDSRNGDTDLVTRYGYNVRSAVTEIKASGSNAGTYGATFTELLYYQNQRPTNPQTSVQWAGNVSAMDWKVGSNGTARRYDFTYDNLSRLTGASYGDNAGGTGSYNRSYAYDKNGNITSITTPDGTTSLSYSGNQLSSGSNYTYDANGNLTHDSGLGRSIAYNVLNLPVTIDNGIHLRSGAVGNHYLYSASGVKLQSKDAFPLPLPGQPDTRSRNDYVGNLIYDTSSLKTILVDGGYVEVSGTTKNYRYFIQDHLGNNRLVADATGSVLQTNHYGPYGESLSAGASADSGNPYKYSGKEYDTTALSYDFGARYYVPTTIPRWTTMDPLAEKYYSISPYAYCAGNPMNFIDPNGLDSLYAQTLLGSIRFIGENTDDSGQKYLVRGATKRAIKRASKRGAYYQGDLKNTNEVFVLPSESVMDAINNSLVRTTITGLEEGGHIKEGERDATYWDSGYPLREKVTSEGIQITQSISSFLVNGKSEFPEDASGLLYYWHIHPNSIVAGHYLGQSTPSSRDYETQTGLENRGYSGQGVLVGAGNQRVSIYTGKKVVFSIRYKIWKRIWK